MPEARTKSRTKTRRYGKPLTCDLCGQEIEGEPLTRDFGGEEKVFCSEGCADVYESAFEHGMADTVTSQDGPSRPRLRDALGGKTESVHLSVEGMYCAGCSQAIERVLRHEPGVKSADVNFASEQGRIDYDPTKTDLKAALKKVNALGYRAEIVTDRRVQKEDKVREALLLQLIGAFAFGMQVMLLYLTQLYHHYAAGNYTSPNVRHLQYMAWGLATPALFYGGFSILRGAWRSLLAGTANMDTLVALGTLSAYSYSVYVTLTGSGEAYFDSVVMITAFIMLGRYLERIGGIQARKDVRALSQLQPDTAWKRVDEDWDEVEASALSVGDVMLVRPGQRVPTDGEVLEGAAALDESLLTGESTPVGKEPGDSVYAGTIVTDDALICRVTQASNESRLARITQMVTETLNTKPPIQRLADRASAYFTAGILSAAILTFLGWWLIAGRTPPQALLNAVAVLVVACPCALGLATPLALAVTLGRTSRNGILVRKPAALEQAAEITRVAFDKTGTLTQGRLQVVEASVSPNLGLSPSALICVAAGVEEVSEHPVARAIVAACDASRPQGDDFDVVRGQGVSAHVEAPSLPISGRVRVGSRRYLDVPEGHSLVALADERASRGETVVWVGWEAPNTSPYSGQVAGWIALRDEPDESAMATLHQLDDAEVTSAMLSGDTLATVKAIAQELGVQTYEGGIGPDEKARRIATWQGEGEKVAMVGDGVNDAPALAQADLSITVASGTDIAGETSDIILTYDDLTLIPWMIRFARRTHRIIRMNLGWAFAYNLVAVPLAALGIISPVIAAGTMATSSLLVVGNSLRLRR